MNESRTFSDIYDGVDDFISYDRGKSVGLQLEDRLKKSPLGGYTKPSVEQYASDMAESMSQMRANFENQIRTLSAECSKLNSECDVLRRQTQQAEAEKKDVQESLSQRIQENRDLTENIRKLQEASSKAEEYQATIQELQDELEKKSVQTRECETRIAQMQSEMQSQKEEIKKNIEELESKLKSEQAKRLKAASQGSQGEKNDALKNDKNNITGENGADASKMNQSYDLLYDRYSTLKGRLEQMKAEKSALEALLQKYQIKSKEMSVLQGENEELRNIVREFEEINAEMSKEMESQQRCYRDLVVMLNEKNAAFNELNSQRTDLQMRNVKIMEQMEELVKENSQLSGRAIYPLQCEDDDENDNISPRRSEGEIVQIDLSKARKSLDRAKEIGNQYKSQQTV